MSAAVELLTEAVIEVTAAAVLDELACRPTPHNLVIARRVAMAVLHAVEYPQTVAAMRRASAESFVHCNCDEILAPALARVEARP